MGYSCCIFSFPLREKVETKQQIKDLYDEVNFYERVLEYDRNGWAKEHFSTNEEYVKYIHNTDFKVNAETLEFYKDKLIKDEFDSLSLFNYLFSTCSAGSFLNDIIYDNNDDEIFILQKEDILNLIFKLINEIKLYKFKSCNISMTFRDEDDGDGIHLIPCDGVELKFYNGESECIKRKYTTEDCELLIATELDDSEHYTVVESLLDICVNIYHNFNFEINGLAFSGGW